MSTTKKVIRVGAVKPMPPPRGVYMVPPPKPVETKPQVVDPKPPAPSSEQTNTGVTPPPGDSDPAPGQDTVE